MAVRCVIVALGLSAAGSAAFGQCVPAWQGPHTPGTTWEHKIAYDTARQRLVMFGGAQLPDSFPGSDVFQNYLYEWDGARWRGVNAPEPRPSARAGHALAYDAARARTVLFGGSTNFFGTVLGDTWLWDGAGWTLAATSGPPARESATMTYDAVRERVVLFGGDSGGGVVLGDTWTWDGASWTLAATTGPTARRYAAGAFDAQRGMVTLYGGLNTSARSDLWEWDGAQWTQRLPVGSLPGTRWAAAFNWDAQGSIMTLYGGNVGNRVVGSQSALSGGSWATVSPGSPNPGLRYVCASGFHAHTGRLLLQGGFSSTGGAGSSETWSWNGASWSMAAPAEPACRYRPALMAVPNGRVLQLANSQLTEWNGGQWIPRGQSPVPAGLAVYDSLRGRVVALNSAAGRTFEHDGVGWVERAVSGPPARSFTYLCFDSVRGRTVMHGGQTQAGASLTDTWEWDGAHWTEVVTPGPTPRLDPGMAFDPVRARTVLYAGFKRTAPYGQAETWEFDGQTWVLVRVDDHDERREPGMAFDPVRGRLLAFGGYLETASMLRDDVREWTGTHWRQLVCSGPRARQAAGIAFDSIGGEMVMSGGSAFINATNYACDSWTLRTAGLASMTGPAEPRFCRGQTRSMSIEVEPAAGVSYQWQRRSSQGTPATYLDVSDGLRTSGAGYAGTQTAVFTISGFTPLEMDNYRCRVTVGCDTTFTVPAFTLFCRADFDCSGVIVLDDLFNFLAAWFAGAPAADMNGFDGVSIQDVFDFLGSYFVGCR